VPKLVILGSAHAVPDQRHENTHMILCGSERIILVDCPGNPVVRLRQVGIDPLQVTDLILTHFHPDHVSGVSLFLLAVWLLGRQEPLNIYGLDETIDRVKQMMELFNWREWPGFYPVHFNTMETREFAPVLHSSDITITASATRHMIPSVALRFEFQESHQAIVYSSDTGPSAEVARLASDVEILIHEAAGPGPGHSSAAQAGEIARQAHVKNLILIHYDPNVDLVALAANASASFSGPVRLAEDFMIIELPYQPTM